jgi:LuxR family quorum sensing-dependent transcriptional regulator
MLTFGCLGCRKTALEHGGNSVLALIEKYLDRIRTTRNDTDVIEILKDLSAALGFRSGYLIEYVSDLKAAVHIIDSNPARSGWWQDFAASGLRKPEMLSTLLEQGGIQHFDASRFAGPTDPVLAFSRKVDMVDLVLVPVSFNGIIIGRGGFSGNPTLTQSQQSALQLIVYSLFAQTRGFRNVGVRTAAEPLTPREKEVIRLSADGLTSLEIAERLGMSPRTVNQHVDNVADKLGTKNRAHTVAEAIRHNLLS